MRQTVWRTPSSSTTSAVGGSSTGSRSVSPLASESPQMAERLARHERRRSRRSLLALGVVCSWGRMSVPGGLSSRAPMTPVVCRSTPLSSVAVMRYAVKVGPVVDHEGAVGQPRREVLARHLVPLVAVRLGRAGRSARRCADRDRRAPLAAGRRSRRRAGRSPGPRSERCRSYRMPAKGSKRATARSLAGSAMAFALDLDGVIWLGEDPIPGAAEAVARLRAAGEAVVFCTNNSSQPVGAVEAKLAAHGIPAEGDVITSAMAGASLVEPGERVLVCAGPGVVEALEARGAVRGARRRRRRRDGRVPPGLRLRAHADRVHRRPARRPAPRHERRQQLSHARRASSPAAARSSPRSRRGRGPAPSWPASRTRPWPTSSAPASVPRGRWWAIGPTPTGSSPGPSGTGSRSCSPGCRPPTKGMDPAPDVVAADLADAGRIGSRDRLRTFASTLRTFVGSGHGPERRPEAIHRCGDGIP